MAQTIALTVSDLTLPSTPGVTHTVGTPVAADKYLTAQQVMDNLQLPFTKYKNVVIPYDDDYIVSSLEYDAALMFRVNSRPFTVTLPLPADAGHSITLINSTSVNMNISAQGLAVIDNIVDPGTVATFYQSAAKWIRETRGVTTTITDVNSRKIPTEGAVLNALNSSASSLAGRVSTLETAFNNHKNLAAGGNSGHIKAYVSGTTLYLIGAGT